MRLEMTTLRWRFTVKCPHCERRFWAWGPNRLYLKLYSHMRRAHWAYYQRQAQRIFDELDGLIE